MGAASLAISSYSRDLRTSYLAISSITLSYTSVTFTYQHANKIISKHHAHFILSLQDKIPSLVPPSLNTMWKYKGNYNNPCTLKTDAPEIMSNVAAYRSLKCWTHLHLCPKTIIMTSTTDLPKLSSPTCTTINVVKTAWHVKLFIEDNTLKF